jgi:hypothetical protein
MRFAIQRQIERQQRALEDYLLGYTESRASLVDKKVNARRKVVARPSMTVSKQLITCIRGETVARYDVVTTRETEQSLIWKPGLNGEIIRMPTKRQTHDMLDTHN